MTPPVPDYLRALMEHLKADVDLIPLVGSRVFYPELPPNQSDLVQPAVSLIEAGGLSGATAWQEYGEVRVDIRCWAETPNAARDIWFVVYPSLKQLQRVVQNDTLIHRCSRDGGPITMRDPDTRWPSVWSAWRVLVAEIPIAA